VIGEPDSEPRRDEDKTEYERFEELARKLAKVSKRELDELREKEKREKG
jgi:hypothetical protein